MSTPDTLTRTPNTKYLKKPYTVNSKHETQPPNYVSAFFPNLSAPSEGAGKATGNNKNKYSVRPNEHTVLEVARLAFQQKGTRVAKVQPVLGQGLINFKRTAIADPGCSWTYELKPVERTTAIESLRY